MDGWEAAFLTLLVAIVIGALGFVSYSSVNSTSILSLLKVFFFAITNFIPFGLITFGVIADLIGQELRYSLGSIVGFVAIVLNFIVSKFMGFSVDVNSTSEASNVMAWCMIPGLESLESKLLPMNIVSSSAIMMYYLIFASRVRQTSQNVSIYIAFPLLFALQLAAFYSGGCQQYYLGGIGSKVGALVFGSLIGVFGWSIVSQLFPSNAPFLSLPNGGSQGSSFGSSNLPVAPSSTGVGGAPTSGAKCSQDNSQDGDEFVCEAYKNGVLVTEQISK
jgi:hypothetical protein